MSLYKKSSAYHRALALYLRRKRQGIFSAPADTVDNLLANDVEAASEVSSPVLTQAHALLANDAESASDVGSPVLTQAHALLANDVESSSEVTTPALSESHALLANDVESASEVTTPALGQAHSLAANDAESASEVAAPVLTQAHALLANDVESASEVSSPVLASGSDHNLLANDVQSASEVSTPTIGQVHAILANDIESDSEVSSPVLTQYHVLLANDIESASEVSIPVLSESGAVIGDVYNAAAFFGTGQTVTISLYDPITLNPVSVSDNSCPEISSTGVYIWNSTKLTAQPTSYQEYIWRMTDGTAFVGGVIRVAALTVDDIFSNVMENGETFADQIRILRAEAAGKLTRSGSIHTFRDAADSKDRIVSSADDTGRTPTSVDGT